MSRADHDIAALVVEAECVAAGLTRLAVQVEALSRRQAQLRQALKALATTRRSSK